MQIQHFCQWSFSRITKLTKRRLPLILFAFGIVVFLYRWGFLCTNIQTKYHVKRLCSSYKNGDIIGNLCDALCHPEKTSVLSCHSFYMEKEAVFSGIWNNETVVFKSIRKSKELATKNLFLNSTIVNSEDNFIGIIKTIINFKFNLFISDIDAKRMSYIQFSQPGGNRYVEMKNVWTLLNDNEYLALSLYEQFDIFPKLLGTCGSLFAVEKLNSISGYWHLITLYDGQKEWEKRVKISIMILDFLHQLEKKLPEPLLLCDIKMNNLGVTDDFKKVKFLDLDSVHPVSVASRITADGSDCKFHTDCDLLDCRSFCNLKTHKCQHGVVNNNLQIVCERIFLGWMMGRKLMVPGLLVGSHTPPVLMEILEECANPMREDGIPRAKATKEIRTERYCNDLATIYKTSWYGRQYLAKLVTMFVDLFKWFLLVLKLR